ncbi:hypothetical protein Poli38472_013371 [Pythium oligandrum]|uniref:Uncharacterized protein n=1 Tax=Pythium oligandrum TaxID=41045 RepID=A0A8K1C8G2_PYTOL|nr:hypothetical protein Poli38472_013371 [Pythium oligandrum]|eukprot:TMW57897.1 hypothetical protein Poli38472_013371 [Pythium oligandrum]
MSGSSSPENDSLPALSPLTAPLSEKERQERQRLHMRRTYYRKMNRLQALRDQVQELKNQYEDMLDQYRLQEACALIADVPYNQDEGMRTLYTDISEVKERLLQQNEAMQAALEGYKKFTSQLRRFVTPSPHADVFGPSQFVVLLKDAVSSTSHDASFVVPRLRAPLTLEFCERMAKQTYLDMGSFLKSTIFQSTGMSVYGWRDKRHLDGEWVKFDLKKTFHNLSVDDIAFRGWDFLSSPKKTQQLYSASMIPRVYGVQRIDDRNSVLLRVFTSPDGLSLVKFFFLTSLFETPTGYCVILRWLDHNLLVPPKHEPLLQEFWMDCYGWVTFDRAGDADEHSKIAFGGDIHSSLGVGPDAWMLEALFLALRWETHVVGSIFL